MKLTYDEISPITGNKCVLVESIGPGMDQKICMESGFMTMDILHEDHESFYSAMNSIPDLVLENAIIDDLRYHWHLSIFNIPKVGVLTPIPDETNENKFKWAVAKYIPTLKVDADGNTMYRLDMEKAKEFIPDNFIDAMDELNSIINESTIEEK